MTQEAEGRERGDDSDLRGRGCHSDAENAPFGGWSHWDVKMRGTTRCGRQVSDAGRSRVGKRDSRDVRGAGCQRDTTKPFVCTVKPLASFL